MLLATIDEVRRRHGFDSGLDEVDAAIEQALRSTTYALEGILRTKFAYSAQVTDLYRIRHVEATHHPFVPESRDLRTFRVLHGIHAQVPLLEVKLATSRGMIESEASVTVEAASLVPHLDDPNLVRDLRNFEDGLDHTVIAGDKGLVIIHGLDVTGMFVRLRYAAGLHAASDDVFEDVPNWLREAAILRAAITLDVNPIIRLQDQPRMPVEDMRAELKSMLEPHVRYQPQAEKPFETEVA